MAAKEARDLGSVLEVALGIGGEAPARLRHGDMLANGRQHILEGTSLRPVVMDVVGGQKRRAGALRKRCQAVETGAVAAPIEHVRSEIERPAMRTAEPGESRLEILAAAVFRGQRDQHLPLGMGKQVLPVEQAFSLAHTLLTEGEQPAEAAPGGAIAGVAE